MLLFKLVQFFLVMNINGLGSADAILALVNAGANVEADDKDGLTGKYRGCVQFSFERYG